MRVDAKILTRQRRIIRLVPGKPSHLYGLSQADMTVWMGFHETQGDRAVVKMNGIGA